MAAFRKFFFQLDKNETGVITTADLRDYMRRRKYKASFVTRWIELFDPDCNGSINYDKYCEVLGLKPAASVNDEKPADNVKSQKERTSLISDIVDQKEEEEEENSTFNESPPQIGETSCKDQSTEEESLENLDILDWLISTKSDTVELAGGIKKQEISPLKFDASFEDGGSAIDFGPSSKSQTGKAEIANAPSRGFQEKKLEGMLPVSGISKDEEEGGGGGGGGGRGVEISQKCIWASKSQELIKTATDDHTDQINNSKRLKKKSKVSPVRSLDSTGRFKELQEVELQQNVDDSMQMVTRHPMMVIPSIPHDSNEESMVKNALKSVKNEVFDKIGEEPSVIQIKAKKKSINSREKTGRQKTRQSSKKTFKSSINANNIDGGEGEKTPMMSVKDSTSTKAQPNDTKITSRKRVSAERLKEKSKKQRSRNIKKRTKEKIPSSRKRPNEEEGDNKGPSKTPKRERVGHLECGRFPRFFETQVDHKSSQHRRDGALISTHALGKHPKGTTTKPSREGRRRNMPWKLRSSLRRVGTIVILLAGRHRGKRAVVIGRHRFSGLLLVTGPYKCNGVPIRRIHPNYVIATATKLKMNKIHLPRRMQTRNYFARQTSQRNSKTAKSNLFVDPQGDRRSYEVKEERKEDQKLIDKRVFEAIKQSKNAKMLFAYLRSQFQLSRNDQPHKMIF